MVYSWGKTLKIFIRVPVVLSLGRAELSDSSEVEGQKLQDTSYLASYVRQLERRLKGLESERRAVESERSRLKREVQNMKSELKKLRSPPLVAATLIDLLPDRRALVRSSAGPRFVVRYSSRVDGDQLKPGALVGLSQRSLNIMDILPSDKDPLVRGMEIEEAPDVTYDDVGGLKEQIREIREIVEIPLLKSEEIEKVGVEPPSGVLLHGPPGTGKTLLARAVAHETKATFIRLIGSELVQKFIGEGARMVREMFDMAREKSPSIVFIDEIDAIASRRMESSTSGDREVHRTMMQFLAGLDGFELRGNVKILAATNRPDILDRALLRPGRFDRLIEFPLPDEEARVEILEIHTGGMSLDGEVDLEEFAKPTAGATGADIKAICTEAGMRAIRKDRDVVNSEDFERAISKVLSETERSNIPGVMFG